MYIYMCIYIYIHICIYIHVKGAPLYPLMSGAPREFVDVKVLKLRFTFTYSRAATHIRK